MNANKIYSCYFCASKKWPGATEESGDFRLTLFMEIYNFHRTIWEILEAFSTKYTSILSTPIKEHIDWEGKQIRGAGKKTDVRRATPIALADVIIPVLTDLCEHTSGDKLIRINKDNFYNVYYEAIERAGCRKLPPYACRHTAATSLALAEVQPSVIQKVMRHAKFSTTEKYIHIEIDPMLETVNKLAKQRKEENNQQ